MEYDRPSGKLNKRRLGILAMPVVAGSTAHKRAFKRRIPGKALNTCVHILVDVSGSMSGPKKEIAAKAADRLCVDLSRAVRVPTAVTAFGGDCNVPLWKMKDFHEPAIPGHVAALNNCHGGGNSDGDAVLYAGETLVARKEPRKILIVLSDGMPTGAAAGKSPADMLKTAIKTVKDRGVEVYGIGICDSSVKMFYGKECKVISNLEEFDSALLTTLSDKLIANG
jgi:cobalamin biosynthesis protein CobT